MPGRAAAAPVGLRDVMWVGNNWDGTASVVDARTYKVLKRGVNLIPDKAQEIQDIQLNPVKLALFLAIRVGPARVTTSSSTTCSPRATASYLAVSRPSFADVVWIDIRQATLGLPGAIVREQQMDGFRTDHMALSRDGRRLLVFRLHREAGHRVLDGRRGARRRHRRHDGRPVAHLPVGETPHESNYTRGGKRIFHASIGRVYTPGDGTSLDRSSTRARRGQGRPVVPDRRASTSRSSRWDIGKELAEAGHPRMSSAVRPMAIAPGSRSSTSRCRTSTATSSSTPRRPTSTAGRLHPGRRAEPATAGHGIVILPNRVPTMPRDHYVNDSAHHGLVDRQRRRDAVRGGHDGRLRRARRPRDGRRSTSTRRRPVTPTRSRTGPPRASTTRAGSR